MVNDITHDTTCHGPSSRASCYPDNTTEGAASNQIFSL
uniref:Uncharacterized protein n=1 Tax=Anguilla anguilla TaxID=7936 RepID=A0A0E9QHX3_ANGAN